MPAKTEDAADVLTAPEPAIGVEDLEKGMRAGTLGQLAATAVVAFILLLAFNSGGLLRWTERLPSNPTTAALAGVAGGWHRLMLDLGPARWFETMRERVRID